MKTIENCDLTHFNSYNLKSFCRKAYFPESEGDVLEIFGSSPSTPKILLGNGNNVILSKSYYDYDFVIFNGCYDRNTVEGKIITAESGATLKKLSELAYGEGLSGFEMFYDIPSSVGGAVVMNAGSSGEEIKDVIVKVRFLDIEDMQVHELSRDEIDFEYRNSFFQKNKDKIVLKAWFELKRHNREDIKRKMVDIKKRRWAKQPRQYPNCGSVFKRPPGRFVGPMIDELGLKGFAIGGAQISEKHSGFIINKDQATGEDILGLIRHVQNKVKNNFNLELEVEQQIL